MLGIVRKDESCPPRPLFQRTQQKTDLKLMLLSINHVKRISLSKNARLLTSNIGSDGPTLFYSPSVYFTVTSGHI